jgi:hypothetical protein
VCPAVTARLTQQSRCSAHLVGHNDGNNAAEVEQACNTCLGKSVGKLLVTNLASSCAASLPKARYVGVHLLCPRAEKLFSGNHTHHRQLQGAGGPTQLGVCLPLCPSPAAACLGEADLLWTWPPAFVCLLLRWTLATCRGCCQCLAGASTRVRQDEWREGRDEGVGRDRFETNSRYRLPQGRSKQTIRSQRV